MHRQCLEQAAGKAGSHFSKLLLLLLLLVLLLSECVAQQGVVCVCILSPGQLRGTTCKGIKADKHTPGNNGNRQKCC
jgi:hypothetical protein